MLPASLADHGLAAAAPAPPAGAPVAYPDEEIPLPFLLPEISDKSKTRSVLEWQFEESLGDVALKYLQMTESQVLNNIDYARGQMIQVWGKMIADLMLKSFGVVPKSGLIYGLRYAGYLEMGAQATASAAAIEASIPGGIGPDLVPQGIEVGGRILKGESWLGHRWPIYGPGTPYRAEAMLPHFEVLQDHLINSSFPLDVQQAVDDVFEIGLGVPDKMTKNLHEALRWTGPGPEPTWWQTSVQRTARTESQSLWNAASYERMILTGVPTKIWRTMKDPRVRSSHQKMSGDAVPVDQPFVVNGHPMRFPGDPQGPPEEVYNCRCDMDSGDGPLPEADTWNEIHDPGKPPELSYTEHRELLLERLSKGREESLVAYSKDQPRTPDGRFAGSGSGGRRLDEAGSHQMFAEATGYTYHEREMAKLKTGAAPDKRMRKLSADLHKQSREAIAERSDDTYEEMADDPLAIESSRNGELLKAYVEPRVVGADIVLGVPQHELDKEYFFEDELQDLRSPEIVTKMQEHRAEMISKDWVRESYGADLQEAARSEFGIHDAAALSTTAMVTNGRSVWKVDVPGPKENAATTAGMKANLRAQYDATQDVFSKAGVSHLRVYRGTAADHGEGSATVSLRPLSSFSVSPIVAGRFAINAGVMNDTTGSVIAMDVPVERIASMPGSGMGSVREMEVVLLGGTYDAEMYVPQREDL